MNNTDSRWYESKCRYCNRYGKACGRIHAAATVGDWSRTWNGYPQPVVVNGR